MSQSNLEQENKTRPELIDIMRNNFLTNADKLTVDNELTQDLLENGPQFIQQVFSEYGINVPILPTKTLFVAEKSKEQLEKIFQDDYTNLGGAYLPILDLILIFLDDNLIIDVHNYFHELIHTLGKCAVWIVNNQVVASRVGYSFSLHDENYQVINQRGDFLEESTVDWLASRATSLYLSAREVELPEKEPERFIADLAGGRYYTHMRDCLTYITKKDPELFNLFLQARFNPDLIKELATQLTKLYKTGTMSLLNKLDSRDPFTNDKVIMKIRPN
jgi:hypothetical protein